MQVIQFALHAGQPPGQEGVHQDGEGSEGRDEGEDTEWGVEDRDARRKPP